MLTDVSSSQPMPQETGNKKKGIIGWFKKIFVRRGKENTVEVVLDKNKAENNGLVQQKKFYERLFSRSNQAPTIKPPLPPTPPKPITPQPVVPITPKPENQVTVPTPAPGIKIPSPLKPEAISAPLKLSTDDTLKKPALNVPVPNPHHPTSSPAPKPVKKSFNIFQRFFSKNLSQVLAAEREKELAWHERNQIERKFWQPSSAIKPNLIKNQEVLFFNWHENLLVLGLSLMMCCLAIGFLYVGLLIWQKERLDTSRTALENSKVIDKQIDIGEQAAQEIKVFTTKLNLVNDLLNNHVYWTNFLAFLENKTLEDVYYEKFSGDLSGEYTIPGVARNLQAITLQLEVMKTHDKVKSLTPDTGQASADGKSLLFNLGMSIDPTLFLK